jgi:hypothetical protein
VLIGGSNKRRTIEGSNDIQLFSLGKLKLGLLKIGSQEE